MKIVQLIIDENIDMAGVDGIALVEKPAHMENWLAFNETKPVWESLSSEQMGDIAKVITQFGETENDLKEQGYVLVKVEEVPHYEFYDSNPNPSSEPDNSIRIRYKYVGPPAEREFCQIMMSANKVYTQDDLDGLSGADVNPIGPSGYSILQWRGSFNCRHKFVKLTYAPKNEVGNIVNKGTVRKGLINEQVGTLYDTRTTSTINAGNTPQPRVGGFSMVGKIDGQPLFSTVEEALQMAKVFGCEGYHEHKVGESTFYMPCDKHNFSFNDYPKQAKENACKVLRWIDEHGRQEVSGMERTGLQRANQLCKGERISEDTVRRMASFERHRRNSQIDPRFQGTPWRDKGYVAWLAWGGDEGIQWAQRKLSVLKKEEMELDLEGLTPYVSQTGKTITEEVMIQPNPCTSGYVAYGTKIKDGREVPNCIPVQQSAQFGEQKFSLDDEKREITGAAVIPNKFIIRYDEMMQPYYVFFSKETTKMLSEKFMKDNKMTDVANIEHTDKKADKTYLVESWLVEDTFNDKSNALGLEYPEGTWVITMKVQSDEVWNDIKKGRYKGYSIEGFFEEKLMFSEDDLVLQKINEIISETEL
jgi:hypothetical protein